jgi:hypothetical protein
MIDKLNEEIQSWDKMESAVDIYYMYGWGKKKEDLKETKQPKNESEDLAANDLVEVDRGTYGKEQGKILSIEEDMFGSPYAKVKLSSGLTSSYDLTKLTKIQNDQNESEDDDYRDDTQGHRNAKYLKKARFYADTPQARLKKQRTELKKELRG